jgi:hypothetical protein
MVRHPRLGDVVRGPFGPAGTYEWFVVDDISTPSYPLGPCFISLDGARVGYVFGLPDCERVPPSKLPQYALVALAKFRLTQ